MLLVYTVYMVCATRTNGVRPDGQRGEGGGQDRHTVLRTPYGVCMYITEYIRGMTSSSWARESEQQF